MPPHSIPYSILDLSPIIAGGDAAQSFRNTLDLARHAERLGYQRYWLAEHHGMPGIASAATSVVISHVLQGTESIRVGAGGIMLPNHSPLVIAEQFGTLETLYPGRVDLGLGRAPGSDQKTAKALRRSLESSPDAFPRDVVELQNYFQPPDDQDPTGIRAVPGNGLDIPIWILGSSLFGAQLAAALGLPYAFASHFAPAHLPQAMRVYREQFSPAENSAKYERPYFMPALNVVAADTDEEAQFIASSMQQAFVNLVTHGPMPLPAPVADYAKSLSPVETQILNQTLIYSAVGSRETVRDAIARFLEMTGADELMITAHIYDHDARRKSVEIAAGILRELPVPA